MDTDAKKDEDMKTDAKGIKPHLNIAVFHIMCFPFTINIKGKM